jgi:hypothetical protein
MILSAADVLEIVNGMSYRFSVQCFVNLKNANGHPAPFHRLLFHQERSVQWYYGAPLACNAPRRFFGILGKGIVTVP